MGSVNVETKAACDDLEALAGRSRRAGAVFEGTLDQTDTYFAVSHGRLKLREIVDRAPDGRITVAAELIQYERPDEAGARVSRYERTPIDAPSSSRAALEARHGVRAVVRKQRDLWLLGPTRIHLDRVDGLGTFVELETVVVDGTLEGARAEHERVLRVLEIDLRDAIAGSYVDLLAPLAK